MSALSINAERLLSRIRALGEIGRDGDSRLTRLAASDADTAGRDQLVQWLREANLEIAEEAARGRDLASKRMTSGAGRDAQMIARIAPAAMIFVPSVGGISHNPREYTPDADLVAGANVLLDVIQRLAAEGKFQ